MLTEINFRAEPSSRTYDRMEFYQETANGPQRKSDNCPPSKLQYLEFHLLINPFGTLHDFSKIIFIGKISMKSLYRYVILEKVNMENRNPVLSYE